MFGIHVVGSWPNRWLWLDGPAGGLKTPSFPVCENTFMELAICPMDMAIPWFFISTSWIFASIVANYWFHPSSKALTLPSISWCKTLERWLEVATMPLNFFLRALIVRRISSRLSCWSAMEVIWCWIWGAGSVAGAVSPVNVSMSTSLSMCPELWGPDGGATVISQTEWAIKLKFGTNLALELLHPALC